MYWSTTPHPAPLIKVVIRTGNLRGCSQTAKGLSRALPVNPNSKLWPTLAKNNSQQRTSPSTTKSLQGGNFIPFYFISAGLFHRTVSLSVYLKWPRARRSALGALLSALGSRRSALGARLSALGSRRSALGARLSALCFVLRAGRPCCLQAALTAGLPRGRVALWLWSGRGQCLVQRLRQSLVLLLTSFIIRQY